MSDGRPVNDPGGAAPGWVALPTTPWVRVLPGQRSEEPDSGSGAPGLPGRRPTGRATVAPAPAAGPLASESTGRAPAAGPGNSEPVAPGLAGRASGGPGPEEPEDWQENWREEWREEFDRGAGPESDGEVRGWFATRVPAADPATEAPPAPAAPPSQPLAPSQPPRQRDPVDPKAPARGSATPVRPPTDETRLMPLVRPAQRRPGLEPDFGAEEAGHDLPPGTRPVSGAGAGPVPRSVSGAGSGARTASGGRPVPEPAGPDPEQLLAAFRWRFDPETLREVVDDDEAEELRGVRDLLTAKINNVAENAVRARLLSLRAVVSRILGDLHQALADGKLGLAHAEATGELRRIAIAQARLAHVLQWNGDYEEADRLFALANSSELPDRLRATMHQHAGRCAYDQGRHIEACTHFERAVELRHDEDPDLIEQTALALDAVFRRVGEQGWGPYPRAREEILKIHKPPAPEFDERARLWGFADPAGGGFLIPPGYLDVQPFRDGAAWVQPPGSHSWGLIDEEGRILIEPASGYLGVSSFADGLAWVSRDGVSRWIAVDKSNRVLISTGFDDVRPFRRGLAAVRRGGRWGAVDGAGRMIVPCHYDGFATALHDGRYIDGFSDEGLAVVSLGKHKGVVDRTGRVLVAPAYHLLVIHPVAFLIVDDRQRWGALDRRGRPLIDPMYPSRALVVEELDQLLADTRPML